jgi:hypothetical protein
MATRKNADKHWTDVDPNKWTDDQIKDYIWDQNNYCYDGNPPIHHSADDLFRFAEPSEAMRERFNGIYDQMYPKKPMKTYKVRVAAVAWYDISVEAENVQKAEELAVCQFPDLNEMDIGSAEAMNVEEVA